MSATSPRPTPHSTPGTDPRVHQARIGLLALFALMGLSFAAWVGRFPTVRAALDLTTAELGVVLLAGAIGSLIFVTLSGTIVQRFGGRSVLTVSAFGIALAFVLEGLGPAVHNVQVLAVGVFLNGVFTALTNVPQNVETAAVERRIGRSVLPHFHAAYSIGAVAGSLLGAACSALNVPIFVQMVVTAALTLVVRLALIPRVVLDTELTADQRWDRADDARRKRVRRAETRAGLVIQQDQGFAAVMRSRRASLGSALGAWREPRTLFIGLIIFAASLSEGSANNWLSIAVVDGFEQKEAIGAITLGLFLAAMTSLRVLGTKLIDRFGRVAVLRTSTITSIVGLLAFGFSPQLWIALAGVVLWGMGAALAFPLGISGVSDEPLKSAARVSVVSAFASTAALAAPPVLGLVAESIGARRALTFIVFFMVISVLLSRNVAPLKTRDSGSAVAAGVDTETPSPVIAGTDLPSAVTAGTKTHSPSPVAAGTNTKDENL